MHQMLTRILRSRLWRIVLSLGGRGPEWKLLRSLDDAVDLHHPPGVFDDPGIGVTLLDHLERRIQLVTDPELLFVICHLFDKLGVLDPSFEGRAETTETPLA